MNQSGWVILLIAALGAGCTAGKSYRAERLDLPVTRIAVLPAHNQTPSEEGGALARLMVQRWLVRAGYVTVPATLVDEAAEGNPSKNSGALSTEELKAWQARTGADGIMLVDLVDFESTHSGFRQEARVAITMRLLHAPSGKVLWQNSGEETQKKSTINPTRAITDYVRSLATRALASVLGSPLYDQTSTLVSRLLQTLPSYGIA